MKKYFIFLVLLPLLGIAQRNAATTDNLKDEQFVFSDDQVRNAASLTLYGLLMVKSLYYDTSRIDYNDIVRQALVGAAAAADTLSLLKQADFNGLAWADANKLYCDYFSRIVLDSGYEPYDLALISLDFALSGLDDSHTYVVTSGDGEYMDNISSTRIQSSCGLAYLYCRISSFSVPDEVEREIIKPLNDLGGIDAVIFDLRGNSGGLLRLVREISEIFLPFGSELWTIESNGKIDQVLDLDNRQSEIPVIMLVDKVSASASEILAAVFRAHYPRIKIVGQKTSGAANVAKAFYPKHCKLSVTSGLIRIKGQLLEKVGIEPDIHVASSDSVDNQLRRGIKEVHAMLHPVNF